MFLGIYKKYKIHYINNLSLAIPVVISQLGHTLVHTADSIIVGQFAGTSALAAVSLVNSIFMVIMMIGIGISYGLTPLIAQENGKHNYTECGKLLVNSLFLNLFFGFALYGLMYFGSVFAINHLNQQPEVVLQSKPYLKLLSISIIPLMFFLTFKQFAEGLGFTKQAMTITIMGNILNILVGITLVKGLFGVNAFGISGVGYSTLIDRCLMALVMCFYVLKSTHFKKYLTHFYALKFDKLRLRRIFKQGAPTALQYTFEVSAFSGAAIIIGTIGTVEQAAHQVALNLASTTYMMASGIAAAATIKTGYNLGAKNFKNLRLSAISSYHIALVFMGFTALLFVAFNNYLPMLYSQDARVIQIAASLLLFAAIFQLFDGAQVVGLGVLRGMGDVNIPTLITFLAYWVFGLPVGYYLGIVLEMGVYGVWIGLTLALLFTAIFLFYRFNAISKRLVLK
ncbi:MAG: MATE family efflux transporter [Sphingobacteriales bacterium]|nr:MAG: MATE family efflux transporter [Sphingobacteriales bacterium]